MTKHEKKLTAIEATVIQLARELKAVPARAAQIQARLNRVKREFAPYAR